MGSKRGRQLLPTDLPWEDRPEPVGLDGQCCVDELLAAAGEATTEQILEDYRRPTLPYPWLADSQHRRDAPP